MTTWFQVFQPTLPLRGATRCRGHDRRKHQVSTHAPLAGSDVSASWTSGREARFQPTLPLRGATMPGRCVSFHCMFQPTLPLRGATRLRPLYPLIYFHSFNPRSPCGERHGQAVRNAVQLGVSTHAPLAGSDHVRPVDGQASDVSTHAPLAGSDRGRIVLAVTAHVSTHAPLAGSDFTRWPT